eukprot:GSA25T00024226001.1
MDELAVVSIPPKKDARTEQSVKICLKLFQMALGGGDAGSGTTPTQIGESQLILSSDVGVVASSLWGGFVHPKTRETTAKFLLSYQLALPALEVDLRNTAGYSMLQMMPMSDPKVADSLKNFQQISATTATARPPIASMLVNPVRVPTGLVFSTYDINGPVSGQQKWSWTVGHGPPLTMNAKRLRPPLENAIEVITHMVEEAKGNGGVPMPVATPGMGGMAAAGNFVTKIQDAYKRALMAAGAAAGATMGASAPTNTMTSGATAVGGAATSATAATAGLASSSSAAVGAPGTNPAAASN